MFIYHYHLRYFGHLMQTANSLDKTQMLGKTEGKRRRGRQRMRWLDSITDSVDVNLGKLRESEGQAWCAAVHGVMDSWTQLHDSTATGQISLIQPLASFHNFVANIYHFFVFEGLCLLKPHNYHLMQFWENRQSINMLNLLSLSRHPVYSKPHPSASFLYSSEIALVKFINES